MITKKIKILITSILVLILSWLWTYQTCKDDWFTQSCITRISETFEKAEEVERNLQDIEIIEENLIEFE